MKDLKEIKFGTWTRNN